MSFLTCSPRAAKGLGVAGALVALAALGGCTPDTKYRYSGYVPAARALAWDGRTAKDGTLRLEGTMSAASVRRNLTPQEHDTALRVPNVMAEGAAFLTPAPGFEFGARYAYASYDWSEQSAQGTMPLPSQPSVWGVGPEVRGTLMLDKRHQWALGVGGNLMRYETPYAAWKLTDSCPNGFNATCVQDQFGYISGIRTPATYQLIEEKSESHITMNMGVYPSVALGRDGDLGHVFAGFAVHTTFKNDGFTNIQQQDSTIKDAGLIYIVGIGYAVGFDPFRVAAMLTLPLTTYQSSINYGPSGFVTIGVDLSLWESKMDRRKRILEEDERRRMEEERRRTLPPEAPAPQAPPQPPTEPVEHPI
jgi:hypothetical protein